MSVFVTIFDDLLADENVRVELIDSKKKKAVELANFYGTMYFF